MPILLSIMMSDEQIALWILTHGGSVSQVSLYDEEGVEGWRWEFNGKEYYEIGDWNDMPMIPRDMIAAYHIKYPQGI